MDRSDSEADKLSKRVKDEIFFKPALSLLPLFIGVPMALGPWVLGTPAALVTGAGLGLSLFSLGVYVTRVCLNWGDVGGIRSRLLQADAAERAEAVRRRLVATRVKLVKDGDSTTELMFDRLVALQDTLSQESERSIADLEQSAVIERVEELISASISNLEESAHLAVKAKGIRVPSVAEITLQQRRDLLRETEQSIESIESSLLAFVKNQKNYKVAETSRIREELEVQLEISERVKQQMESWQSIDIESKL